MMTKSCNSSGTLTQLQCDDLFKSVKQLNRGELVNTRRDNVNIAIITKLSKMAAEKIKRKNYASLQIHNK